MTSINCGRINGSFNRPIRGRGMTIILLVVACIVEVISTPSNSYKRLHTLLYPIEQRIIFKLMYITYLVLPPTASPPLYLQKPLSLYKPVRQYKVKWCRLICSTFHPVDAFTVLDVSQLQLHNGTVCLSSYRWQPDISFFISNLKTNLFSQAYH